MVKATQTPEEKSAETNARLRVAAAVKRTLDNTDLCRHRYLEALDVRYRRGRGGMSIASRLEESHEIADTYLWAANRAGRKAAWIDEDTGRWYGPYNDEVGIPRETVHTRIARWTPASKLRSTENSWKRAAKINKDLLSEIEHYKAQVALCIDYAEGQRDNLSVNRDEYAKLKTEEAEEKSRIEAHEAERSKTAAPNSKSRTKMPL